MPRTSTWPLFSWAAGLAVSLLLLPARAETLVVELPGRPGPTITRSYTHLGWQDALGPLSGSRVAAAGAGLLVALLLRALGRARSRLSHT